MANEIVASEITGKVWKIVAQPGAKLAEEDTIMILESMKMEIPVTAPVAGTLVKISVKEGDDVSEGQAVAELST